MTTRARQERWRRDETLLTVCYRGGFQMNVLSLIERGRLIPTSDELDRLKKALEYPGDPAELLQPVEPDLVHV
jgi:hypothetical protein